MKNYAIGIKKGITTNLILNIFDLFVITPEIGLMLIKHFNSLTAGYFFVIVNSLIIAYNLSSYIAIFKIDDDC